MATKLLRYPSEVAGKPGTAACLGNFDGVHMGHRYLLEKLGKAALEKDLKTMLISFYPHPSLVLGKALELPRITEPREMLKIANDADMHFLYFIHFTKSLSELSAADFIEKILIKKLNVQFLLVGEDARVGRNGEGDSSFIVESLTKLGRKAEIQKFIDLNGVRVSSRLVRDLIREGDVEKGKQLLGREFSIEGRVVKGESLGKKLGFPTANVNYKKSKLVPKNGVYATLSEISGKVYTSVTNIGVRPTVAPNSEDRPTIETYLIDFKGPDFYGQKINIRFVKHLRDEKKFPSVENLKMQIQSDVVEARRTLDGE